MLESLPCYRQYMQNKVQAAGVLRPSMMCIEPHRHGYLALKLSFFNLVIKFTILAPLIVVTAMLFG